MADGLKGAAVRSRNEDTVSGPVTDQLNVDLIHFLAKQLLKSCIPENPGDPKLLNHCNVFNHKTWPMIFPI